MNNILLDTSIDYAARISQSSINMFDIHKNNAGIFSDVAEILLK